MSAEPSPDRTAPHGLDEGIELACRAQDAGDWKPVVEWLARHPAFAESLARFMGGDRRLEHVVNPPQPVARAGTVLGNFELVERLGSGAMGDVFQARRRVGRDVAVKVVRTAGMSEAERARVRFEVEAMAGLSHPNVVPLFEYGETDSELYFAMPLMTDSLANWLKGLGPDRQLAPARAAEIVRDIARGVHHAHQHGLIHRDLKPANILLDADGVPHIADFGLARRADATASTAAGSPAYMAPEQARGERHLTTAADVHALGVILFELLTGRTPFRGSDVVSVLRSVADDPAPAVRQLAPSVSKDLEAVCLKCLEKQPGARYASALELADDLDRYLRGAAVTARPPGFWDWLRQLARTRPEPHPEYSWRVTVWFGAAILVANTAIYLLARGGGSALDVWLVNITTAASMTAVLWWYMLRRVRQLPTTERHSLIVAAGKIIAYFPVMLAYVPFSESEPARTALAIYPTLGALSGLAFFVLGSTNWSRFFPVGLGMLALMPTMAWWPEESPLIYGGAITFVLWYWSVAKKDGFGYKPDDACDAR